MYSKVKKIPSHKCMLDVSEIIFQTCKTYLIQQGKFLLGLEIIIGICMFYYFGVLQRCPSETSPLILGGSIVGILGSYGVAWFGIRMNTLANSRMAFSSLEGKPMQTPRHPPDRRHEHRRAAGLRRTYHDAPHSRLPAHAKWPAPCFIGFAIGESLGASALRICGGIFTKIADIGSDLMKIVFTIKEDDPAQPRRYRRLHRRQCRRQRRPHGGRFRDLRRYRCCPHQLHRAGLSGTTIRPFRLSCSSGYSSCVS